MNKTKIIVVSIISLFIIGISALTAYLIWGMLFGWLCSLVPLSAYAMLLKVGIAVALCLLGAGMIPALILIILASFLIHSL